MASSTARNCFNNSSRRVVFFELDSDLEPEQDESKDNSINKHIPPPLIDYHSPEVLDELFFSDAVLSCRLFAPCLARFFADVSDDPESDPESESEPLEFDESELDE